MNSGSRAPELPAAAPVPHPVRAVQELDARHRGDAEAVVAGPARHRGAHLQGRERHQRPHQRPGRRNPKVGTVSLYIMNQIFKSDIL